MEHINRHNIPELDSAKECFRGWKCRFNEFLYFIVLSSYVYLRIVIEIRVNIIGKAL